MITEHIESLELEEGIRHDAHSRVSATVTIFFKNPSHLKVSEAKLVLSTPGHTNISDYMYDVGALLGLGEGWNKNVNWNLYKDTETGRTFWKAEGFRERCPKCLSDQYGSQKDYGQKHECSFERYTDDGLGSVIDDAVPLLKRVREILHDGKVMVDSQPSRPGTDEFKIIDQFQDALQWIEDGTAAVENIVNKNKEEREKAYGKADGVDSF